jgi:hypothetical protein
MAAAEELKGMALDEEDIQKRKQKAEDMSKLVDDKLPAAAALAHAGNLAAAVDLLLTTEKLTRQVRLNRRRLLVVTDTTKKGFFPLFLTLFFCRPFFSLSVSVGEIGWRCSVDISPGCGCGDAVLRAASAEAAERESRAHFEATRSAEDRRAEDGADSDGVCGAARGCREARAHRHAD